MEEQHPGARCADILRTCLYANIATCRDSQPWNTPATAVPDSNLDIYWSSWTEAVHSKNIRANPYAFLTYYDSMRPRGTNNRRCVYLRCEAAVVSDEDEAKAAHALLYPGEDVRLDDFFDSGLRRVYRARPLQAWLNCLSEQQVQPDTLDMRREVSLQDIQGAL